MHPKISSSWILRLAALVCLACAISISSACEREAAGENQDGAAAPGLANARTNSATERAARNDDSPIDRSELKEKARSSAAAKDFENAATSNAASSGGECFRAAIGSEVPEPEDLRSVDGVLKVDLAFRTFVDSKGEVRFCYVTPNGKQSPTLRVKPGDTVILNFKNEATAVLPQSKTVKAAQQAGAADASAHSAMPMNSANTPGAPCATGAMKATSTNLHFHGLTVPAECHQDDVMRTLIDTGSAPYEYKFQIPADEPPGLYWYHPHIHGFTKAQVLGGASAALVVEGIERAIPDVAGLPERVFVIRDQNLANPDAAPVDGTKLPPVVLDADGDVMNTGTGTGKPAEDLTINYVPVPYPDYPPATITMKPGERQLWRVLNASAITYLSLQVLFGPQAQAMEVVALDGVPIHPKEAGLNKFILLTHLGIPPGGRIEFVMHGPPAGTKAELVTRSVNTGAMGENDPNRALANIVAKTDAP
ncbi:MAG TPA: multicopper oxidase domain-containing protein, partial [Candidatus Acidoferrum sp.]|nr:multicopper oxidase domain-containing protein [Candidatus Acidoferrum sp.]